MILLDSIGELHYVYSLASIVFVGGSLAKTGGHNIIEPAAIGVPVIIGPHTYNFHSIVETFLKAGAVVQLNPISDSAAIVELADVLFELLENPTRRTELGTRAQNLVRKKSGRHGTHAAIARASVVQCCGRRWYSALARPSRAFSMKSDSPLILLPFSGLYSAVTRARLTAYRRGWLSVSRLAAPVISVGNLTTGGTGKTPLVEWVCRVIAADTEDEKKVCVLTRGYRRVNPQSQVVVSNGTELLADEREAGDEAFLLAQNLLGVAAVIANPNRFAAGKWAIENLKSEVFVLDDGFQHLQLARDLDIVTIDATNPWGDGNGRLLPYGRLREPLSSLSRAGCFVITRTEQVEDWPQSSGRWNSVAGSVPVFSSRMVTASVRKLNEETANVLD